MVSTTGKIVSFVRKGSFGLPCFIKPRFNTGYLHVKMFSEDGKVVKRYLHNVVLEAFVGPRPAGFHGCHLDGDRLNNRVENLAWLSASDNNKQKKEHGTWQGGVNNGRAVLTWDAVDEIRERLSLKGETCASLAREFGVSPSAVSAIKRHKSWILGEE